MESAELGNAGRRKKDPVRLDIPVRDAQRMCKMQRLCDLLRKAEHTFFIADKVICADTVRNALERLHADQIGIAVKLPVRFDAKHILIQICRDIRAALQLEQQIGFALGTFLCLVDLRQLLFFRNISLGRNQRNDFQHSRFSPVHPSGFQTEDCAVRRGADQVLQFPFSPEGHFKRFQYMIDIFCACHRAAAPPYCTTIIHISL